MPPQMLRARLDTPNIPDGSHRYIDFVVSV
jgi:hypothetical protein